MIAIFYSNFDKEKFHSTHNLKKVFLNFYYYFAHLIRKFTASILKMIDLRFYD